MHEGRRMSLISQIIRGNTSTQSCGWRLRKLRARKEGIAIERDAVHPTRNNASLETLQSLNSQGNASNKKTPIFTCPICYHAIHYSIQTNGEPRV